MLAILAGVRTLGDVAWLWLLQDTAGVGVLIADVYPDTPAAESGLRAGDVIVRMDRRTVREIADCP